MQFVERRIGDRRVTAAAAQVAERRRDRTRGEGRLRAESSPRSWLTCTALRAGPVVPSDVAPTSPKRRRIRAVCGRLRGRIPETGGAKRFLRDLGERCAEFGLDFLRTISPADRRRRGERKPGRSTFWGSRTLCEEPKGRFRLGRKPSAKRMNRTLRRVGERLWRQRHADHREMVEPGPPELFCGGEYALAANLPPTAVAASSSPFRDKLLGTGDSRKSV